MLNKKEKILNYCSQDQSAAEYYHDYYVSPVTYIETSNVYVFNIEIYTDENLHTRKDFVESYAKYKMESMLEDI